jgi:hypothetical protein
MNLEIIVNFTISYATGLGICLLMHQTSSLNPFIPLSFVMPAVASVIGFFAMRANSMRGGLFLAGTQIMMWSLYVSLFNVGLFAKVMTVIAGSITTFFLHALDTQSYYWLRAKSDRSDNNEF